MERGIKLPQGPSEWGFKGVNYLFVIAIDKYAEWKPLNNAVRDVNEIIKLLTSRYQFSPEKTITLLNEDATENNIRKTLLDLKRSLTPEDNLIIFFSGHGEYDEDLDEGYWVPTDAKKNDPKDYISNSDILKWIKAIKTHHSLVLIDSCFSGTLVQHSRGDVLSEKYPSRRIFASGRKELVDDGAPGSHSPFAGAILSRLNNNTDRTMRASELIQNVTKSVELKGGQSPVEGRLKDAGDEGGEFVFHLKVTEEEIWFSVLQIDSIESYSKYLEYYPDGHYAIEARNKVVGFDDTNDWNQANLHPTKTSIKNYLNKHLNGIYYKNALELLGSLEEDEFWNQVSNKHTDSAYRNYLFKYPNGRYGALANKFLKDLNSSTISSDEQNNETIKRQSNLDSKTRSILLGFDIFIWLVVLTFAFFINITLFILWADDYRYAIVVALIALFLHLLFIPGASILLARYKSINPFLAVVFTNIFQLLFVIYLVGQLNIDLVGQLNIKIFYVIIFILSVISSVLIFKIYKKKY